MDLDIEMDDVVETEPIIEPETVDIIASEEQEPGEVEETNIEPEHTHTEENELVPNKVHIRGIDTFNPAEVKAYVAEHSGLGTFERIEWIDDSSANLVFATDSAAQDAVIGLSTVEIADATQLPLQLIPAKPFSAKPESSLQLRFAVVGDRKQQGAAARSRFYLLHPEYDPEERRRRDGNRPRYRDRDGDSGYRRDRYRDRERHDDRRNRYDRDDVEEFDVNLYDDDPESIAKRADQRAPRRRRRHSVSSGSEPDRPRSSDRQQNEGKELFPGREARGRNGLSRGRSASPLRDRDGDQPMEAGLLGTSRDRDRDQSRDRMASARNREKAVSLKERLAKENNSAKELFPDKLGSTSGPSGGKAQMDQVNDSQILASERVVPYARSSQSNNAASKFNIRGIAAQRSSESGIAIKGTGSAKELFPELVGNAGKELFADRLEGRGRRRQRAEDMFH